jgi:hypothetical protein
MLCVCDRAARQPRLCTHESVRSKRKRRTTRFCTTLW